MIIKNIVVLTETVKFIVSQGNALTKLTETVKTLCMYLIYLTVKTVEFCLLLPI